MEEVMFYSQFANKEFLVGSASFYDEKFRRDPFLDIVDSWQRTYRTVSLVRCIMGDGHKMVHARQVKVMEKALIDGICSERYRQYFSETFEIRFQIKSDLKATTKYLEFVILKLPLYISISCNFGWYLTPDYDQTSFLENFFQRTDQKRKLIHEHSVEMRLEEIFQ